MLISLIITLIIVGLLLWAVGTLPIDPTIQQIIRVVVIVCVVLWLLTALFPGLGGVGWHSGWGACR